jgi:hypothetical protein
MHKNLDKILIILVAFMVTGVILKNFYDEYSIDKTKLPLKVETHPRFQSWKSNLKDNNLNIDGDNFKLIKDSNIFNTIWTTTISIDDEVARKLYEENMQTLLSFKESAKSPNEREVVNFTPTDRFGYTYKDVFFYGLREDRILSTKIANCYQHVTCNFHRAAFIDNHVFFITELSQKTVPEEEFKGCQEDEICEYTFKIHLVDLNNNSRTVYESETVIESYNKLVNKL